MSASKDFLLNNLTDELLIEILRRLPTPKSVLAGCILVCKRWHSLIFSSYFLSQFEDHHRNQNKNSYYPAYQNPPSVLIHPILYSEPDGSDNNRLIVVTDGEDTMFDSSEYTLEFLPEENNFFAIVASCNDLLLCRYIKYTVYYVCNPLTRQWYCLPPSAASIARDSLNQAKFGLVYDSNNHRITGGEKYESRFRVVGIKDDSMHVYCSETSQWNEFPVLGEERRPCLSNVVAFDGKLYWCNGRDVVAYDPFTNETIFIDGSDDELSKDDRNVGLRHGICQGTLCLMRLKNTADYLDNMALSYLGIWELKDYDSRRLTLKHRIFFKSENSLVPIGFHPTQKDVVCVEDDEARVFLFRIQRRGGYLEVVGYKDLLRESGKISIFLSGDQFAVTTMLPWWPTPISKAAVGTMSNPSSTRDSLSANDGSSLWYPKGLKD